MAIIELNNIEKSFGKNKVINNFNLKIDDGEFVVLVGPSGCGKTTLAKLILNLVNPTSGEILFESKDISKIKDNDELIKYKRNLQFVFQNPYDSLNPRFTIKDILLEPLKALNFDPNKFETMITDVMNLVKLKNKDEYEK